MSEFTGKTRQAKCQDSAGRLWGYPRAGAKPAVETNPWEAPQVKTAAKETKVSNSNKQKKQDLAVTGSIGQE